LLDQGDRQIQLRHLAGGVIQRRVPGTVVIRIHVIEAGLSLQAIGRASSELNIHSRGLCIAVILVLEVSVNGNRDERNQVINPVAIHTAGELKVLSQSLLHSRLETLNVFRPEFQIVVVKAPEVGGDFIDVGSAEGVAIEQLEGGFRSGTVDQGHTRVGGSTKSGIVVVTNSGVQRERLVMPNSSWA
jgi:hypothetical protein